MPRNTETPRERYAEVPLSTEERERLPKKLKEAIASGPVIEVESGLDLTMKLYGASIQEDGNIHASVWVAGEIRRPGQVAKATGVTIPLVIPAKIIQEDNS